MGTSGKGGNVLQCLNFTQQKVGQGLIVMAQKWPRGSPAYIRVLKRDEVRRGSETVT